MFLQRLWHRWMNRTENASRRRPAPRRRSQLTLEPLEGRAVPASFTAASVTDLIADITTANQTPEADTITLAPGIIFTLKQANNTAYVAGLPSITASGGPLAIIGNGDTIERSTARKTPAFRLFTVQSGASLTLENLTLQGGLADLGGGAIYNAGTLIMRGVTVQKNTAQLGGGIYSVGSLLLDNCLIQNNQAIGLNGAPAGRYRAGREWEYTPAWDGDSALGGGLCVAGGTATLLGTTVVNNTAMGGKGGEGKYGLPAGGDGFGLGGGVYIASGASVSLDAFAVDHILSNTAYFDPNVYGPFTIV